jgi:hypothetical protein
MGTFEKCAGAFCLGMLLNAGVNILIFKNGVEYTQYHENKDLLEICEKELPRNDQCVLMAVPESKLKIVQSK